MSYIRFIALFLLVLTSSTQAATITVNTNVDLMILANDGLCTLREALDSAKKDSSALGCDPGSGDDVIVFDSNYTMTLAGALQIDSHNVTIDGQPHTVSISGNNALRVFEITGSSTNVTLRNITVMNGYSGAGNNGGGIYLDSQADLTIEDTLIKNNRSNKDGGAILVGGNSTLTVNHSVFENNTADWSAGAISIYDGGIATITDTTFKSNQTGSIRTGGAIRLMNSAMATINRCLFQNNQAGRGGAIGIEKHSPQSSTLIVLNSTFTGNTAGQKAGGGVWVSSAASATFECRNCTFSSNAGQNAARSIYADSNSTVTLKNTIIANGSGGGATECAINTSDGSSFDSASQNNLIEGGTTDCGSPVSVADPVLGSLNNHGGNTSTLPLLPGSPALETGAGCEATDQRGIARPQDGNNDALSACDIGAYEMLNICQTQTEMVTAQCDELHSLFLNTQGQNWTDNTGWFVDVTPCSWFGVACTGSAPNKVVYSLSLSSNGLSGTVPDLNLPDIRQLNLDRNSLSGAVPDFSHFLNLEGLALYNNSFTGSLPDFDLPKLTNLDAANNGFSGPLTDFTKMPLLETLTLLNNNFSGTIPGLTAVPTLKQLNLASNSFSNALPAFSTLTNLEYINVYHNQLTGTIPDFALPKLHTLYLFFNHFTGSLPAFASTPLLSKLNVEGNALTGTLPDLSGLPLDNSNPAFTNFGYNAFTAETGTAATDDDADWSMTQNIAPIHLGIDNMTATSVTLSWDNIPYIGNTGHYEVSYSTTSGLPYESNGGTTADKFITSHSVGGLISGTTYYFVVRTNTSANSSNPNDLSSELSEEIAVTVQGCPSGNILYVDTTGPSTGWPDAMPHLQDALLLAELCAGVTKIQVAQGTYYPDVGGGMVSGDRTATFLLMDGLEVYGGYPSGNNTRNADPATNGTILSGAIGSASATDNSYHVVTAGEIGSTAVLDGFTISDGYSDGIGEGGAGLFCHNATPTLQNLYFTQNQTDDFGGGLIAEAGSFPQLTSVTFDNNNANMGGGLSIRSSSLLLQNVQILANSATANGGGIHVGVNSDLMLFNSVVNGNQAQKGGGLRSHNSNINVINVTFAGNDAANDGGAISSNQDTSITGATLNNVLMWGNTASTATTESFSSDGSGSNTAQYSLVEGSGGSSTPWWSAHNLSDGGNNIDADPLFISSPPAAPSNAGDVHLQPGSPATDSGTNTGCPGDDLDGVTRPQGGTCDIGSYEYDNTAPVLDLSATHALSDILEDSPSGSGDTIASILVNGAITDVNTVLEAIAVIAVDDTNGLWEFSLTGASWSNFTGVSTNAARLLDGGHYLRFTPNADFSGTATLTFRAWDKDTGTPGSTTDTTNNGTSTAFSSTTDTIQISVLPVNDKPSFSVSSITLSALEDAGVQTLTTWAAGFAPGGSTDEAGQTPTYTVSNISNSSLFSSLPSINSAGTLTYTPAAHAFGSSTFDVVVQDNGGTANSGSDTSAAQSITVTITNVNDAPTLTATNPPAVAEDVPEQVITSWASFNAGPNETDSVLGYTVSGISNTALFSSLPTVDTSGTLRYTPAVGTFGNASFNVQVQDNGGTANSGSDTSAAQNVTITVNNINDAPSFSASAPPSVLEDAPAQAISAWAIFNPGTNESDTVSAYTVSNISNTALFSVLPSISNAGVLSYTPAPDAFGTSTFDVKVRDSGGTANGGIDLSTTQSFSLTVGSVNDAPTVTASTPPAVREDAAAQTLTNWASFTPGNNETDSLLAYNISNLDNPGLFAVAPTVDNTGTLRYTPAAGAAGNASFDVQAQDNGGVANGGNDTSSPQNFTISINDINDQPSFSASNPPPVAEDSPQQVIQNWATFDPGNGDRDSVSVYLVGNISDHTLFDIAPVISSAGHLSYTPAPDAFGTVTFEVRVQDNGGTANGGVDMSDPHTFTVTIEMVNDPPVFTSTPDVSAQDNKLYTYTVTADDPKGDSLSFTALTLPAWLTLTDNADNTAVLTGTSDTFGHYPISLQVSDGSLTATQDFTLFVKDVNHAPDLDFSTDPSLPTILEDTPTGSEIVVGDLIQAIVTDVDQGDAVGIAIISSTDTGGTWGYDVGNGWKALGTVSDGGAVLLAPDALLRFLPDVDANGSAALGFRAWDQSNFQNSGSRNNDITDIGGDTAYSLHTEVVSVSVTAVNDAPHFSAANPPSIEEDAPTQTVANWATSFNPGGGNDESGQNLLAYQVSGVSDPALFAVAPAIDVNGVLTYTPAANSSGSSTFAAQVQDDGGTDNNGVDLSAAQTFTINIGAVNDVPVITQGDSLSFDLLEDADTLSINLDATDDGNLDWTLNGASGDANIAVAGLTAVVSYTPVPDFNGSDSLVVTVSDGATTDTITLNFNIQAVNDAPSFTAIAPPAINRNSGEQILSPWAVFVPGGGVDEVSQQVQSYIISNLSNADLFAVAPSVALDGSLSYTPADGALGAASFEVTVQDDGGTDNGGSDSSASQSFTLTVGGLNSVPNIVEGESINLEMAEDSGTLQQTLQATDGDADPLTWQILSAPSNGAAQIEGNDTNAQVFYTPVENFFGLDSLSIEVDDGQGGTDIIQLLINVTPVDDPLVLVDAPSQLDVAFDTLTIVTLNIIELDGDPITWQVVGAATSGSVGSDSQGSFSYTPSTGFSGTDSFSISVDDGQGNTLTHTFNVVVAPSDTPDPDPINPDPVDPDPVIPDPIVPDPIVPDPIVPDPVVPDPIVPDPVIPDPVVTPTPPSTPTYPDPVPQPEPEPEPEPEPPAFPIPQNEQEMEELPLPTVSEITPDIMAQIPPEALGGMTPEQFEDLPADALEGVTADNASGLPPDIIQQFQPRHVERLSSEGFIGNPNNAGVLLLNLDPNVFTPDDVQRFLPEGWEMSPTGELTVPPGTPLNFRTLPEPERPKGLTVPASQDLNGGFGLGGQVTEEQPTVVGSLNDTLTQLPEDNDSDLNEDMTFTQEDNGTLTVTKPADRFGNGREEMSYRPVDMVQAPADEPPGITTDENGSIWVTTPNAWRFRLMPTLKRPECVYQQLERGHVVEPNTVEALENLPDTSVLEVQADGTIIIDAGDGSPPLVFVPSPRVIEVIHNPNPSMILARVEQDDLAQDGLVIDPDGASQLVCTDTESQVIQPSLLYPERLNDLIPQLYPNADSIKQRADGSFEVNFVEGGLRLVPTFDSFAETATADTASAELVSLDNGDLEYRVRYRQQRVSTRLRVETL